MCEHLKNTLYIENDAPRFIPHSPPDFKEVCIPAPIPIERSTVFDIYGTYLAHQGEFRKTLKFRSNFLTAETGERTREILLCPMFRQGSYFTLVLISSLSCSIFSFSCSSIRYFLAANLYSDSGELITF